jgi:hypothetical protein
MVRQLFKWSLILVSLFLLLWFGDVHFLRGQYFNFLTYRCLDHDIDMSKKDMTYTISPSSNGKWKFKIENNDFAYRYFMAYKDQSFIFSDSLLFNYATFGSFYFNEELHFEEYSFNCTTGAEPVIIRPYEKFEYEANINDLLYIQIWNIFNFVDFQEYMPDSVTVQLAFIVNGLFDPEKRVNSNPVQLNFQEINKYYHQMKDGFNSKP